MAVRLEDVVRLADQLTSEEQQDLLDHLQASLKSERPPLQLLVFDVGEWPAGNTLRREDEYGDNGR